jgi:hypothetical protein
MSLEGARDFIAKENLLDGAKTPEEDLRTWRTWQLDAWKEPWFKWCKAQGKVLIQYSTLIDKAQYPGRPAHAENEIWNGHYRRFNAAKFSAYRDVEIRLEEGRKRGEVVVFAAGFWLRWQLGIKHNEIPSRKKKKASRKMDS